MRLHEIDMTKDIEYLMIDKLTRINAKTFRPRKVRVQAYIGIFDEDNNDISDSSTLYYLLHEVEFKEIDN